MLLTINNSSSTARPAKRAAAIGGPRATAG
jgi:hypothetical protein